MFHVRRGNYHFVIEELHKKHGPVVRIAPNVLDLDIPELIKTVYNTKENYLKVISSLPCRSFFLLFRIELTLS